MNKYDYSQLQSPMPASGICRIKILRTKTLRVCLKAGVTAHLFSAVAHASQAPGGVGEVGPRVRSRPVVEEEVCVGVGRCMHACIHACMKGTQAKS